MTDTKIEGFNRRQRTRTTSSTTDHMNVLNATLDDVLRMPGINEDPDEVEIDMKNDHVGDKMNNFDGIVDFIVGKMKSNSSELYDEDMVIQEQETVTVKSDGGKRNKGRTVDIGHKVKSATDGHNSDSHDEMYDDPEQNGDLRMDTHITLNTETA